MRVIAGQKKGHKLLSLPGKNTRPTADFVKEAIFSILFDCSNKRVLDLFSGSGALGFEALSRGARSLELVDRSEKAIQVSRKNTAKLQYEEKTKIRKQKVETFLREATEQYDLIFLDPPYNQNYINASLTGIFAGELLSEEGVVVVEHSRFERIGEEWDSRVVKQKKYGDTIVTLLK